MTIREFEIDKDIRRASTLPGRVYSDPQYFEAQKDRVFARSWQYVGDAARLKAPGRVAPLTLLDGCLNEPLLLTSDDDGKVRCMSNVCTHRGAIVVEGEGHARNLRCRYHGRRFGLDGKFVSMPEFDTTVGFPSEKDNLPQLPLERFGPLLFSGLAPEMPFADWIAPVHERVSFMPLEEFVRDAATSQDYLISANWALYCDNYLEEFHIPYVHAGLAEKIDYSGYRTERFRWGNLQLGIAQAGEPAFELPKSHLNASERVGAFYFWLFPNIMFNFYPWGFSLDVVAPQSAGRTKVAFLSYVWNPALRESGIGAGLNRVEMEDEEVVESVQRGVRSRLYDRGRYSERREVGTHHFHELLADFMRRPLKDNGSSPASAR